MDLSAIAEVITSEGPDLVALQEVDRSTNRSGRDLDRVKELGALTGMHYYLFLPIGL